MYRSNVKRLDNGQVHFDLDLDLDLDLEPEVDGYLQSAAASVADRDVSLQALNEVLRCAPDQLGVLQALYKFHFYRGDLQLAEDLVYQSLIKASLQGGFAHDWAELGQDSADWGQQRGPARSFLYSLKALAFIRLRQDSLAQAESILATLQRLDPHDRVGAQVVRELLEGIEDHDHG